MHSSKYHSISSFHGLSKSSRISRFLVTIIHAFSWARLGFLVALDE
jgi:hypothetical protein